MSKLSKRAIPILIITLFLVSMLPAMPIYSTDGDVTFDEQTYEGTTGSAGWAATSHSGDWSVLLGAPENPGKPSTGAGHVRIETTILLSAITDLGFWYNLKEGNPGTDENSAPYMILQISSGATTHWIVHHMVEISTHGTWLEWELSDVILPIDMYGETNMWHDEGGTDYADLAAVKTAFSGYTVDFVKVAVGEWKSGVDTEYYVDDICINTATYDLEYTAREEDLSIDFVTDLDYVPITRGDKSDKVVIQGSGVTAGETVNLGWDGLKAWDGEKGILNSTEAKGDGTFELWLKVPAAVVGDHFIWVKDLDTGETAMWDGIFEVVPKISMSPDAGLVDDKVTISGYGFEAEVEITIITWETTLDLDTTPSVPDTDELGSWTATFKVPDEGTDYTDYTVYAEDEEGYHDGAEFSYGASVVADPDEGPVGTVVEIEGTGFTEGEVFDSDEVKINGIVCKITKTDTVGANGEFRIEVVIPQTDDEDLDDYELIVTENDASARKAHDHYDVTGLAEIDLDPSFGVQGTTVGIEGWNFTQISGKEIELWLCDYDTKEELSMITDDLDTESNGEFTDTFTAPAESSDLYKIKAKMDTYNIYAYASFRIGLMIVIPTPSSGPTGTRVTLSGTGFTESNGVINHWNATFGDMAIVEDDDGDVDTDSDLLLDGKVPIFYVPTVDPGTYTISVLDIDSDVTVDVEWTVTATTMVEFDPMGAPNEYNVSIAGSYFNAEEYGELEFVFYNVTSDGEADYEDELDVQMNIEDPYDPP